MKIAVVGGGSTYTPELADGLAQLRRLLAVDDLVLVDPAAERLAVVAAFPARLFARHDNPCRVPLDVHTGRRARRLEAELMRQ